MKSRPTVAVALITPALWFGTGIARGAELPGPVPLSRYQAMIEKSPFALATPVAAPPAPTAPFADGLYINGITQVGKDYFVSISSKDQSQKFYLATGEKNPDGISLVSVEWDPAAEKSRVKLQKGSEQGDILFDEGSLRPNPDAVALAQAQAAQRQPGVRPGVPRILPPRIPPGQARLNGRPPPGQVNMPNAARFQPPGAAPLPPQARRRGAPIPTGP